MVFLEAPMVLRMMCVGAFWTVMLMSSFNTKDVLCRTFVLIYIGYSTTNTVVNTSCIGDS